MLALLQGADALSCFLNTANVAALLQTGGSWYLPALLISTMLAVYCLGVEQHLLGRLELPAVNAISEGPVAVLLVYLLSLVPGFVSPDDSRYRNLGRQTGRWFHRGEVRSPHRRRRRLGEFLPEVDSKSKHGVSVACPPCSVQATVPGFPPSQLARSCNVWRRSWLWRWR